MTPAPSRAPSSCTEAILQAFDLLELEGEDLRPLMLGKRKVRLARLLARAPPGIAIDEHTDENGAVVFLHACRMGLEGIVSKRLASPYRSGPSREWIKVNVRRESPPHARHRGATYETFGRLYRSSASPDHDSGGKMLAAMSKVDRYRKEANRCAELAKDASPAFLAEIHQKVAMRYVFMAEDLLMGPNREGDAIERADQMISRLRSDATIEGIV